MVQTVANGTTATQITERIYPHSWVRRPSSEKSVKCSWYRERGLIWYSTSPLPEDFLLEGEQHYSDPAWKSLQSERLGCSLYCRTCEYPEGKIEKVWHNSDVISLVTCAFTCQRIDHG